MLTEKIGAICPTAAVYVKASSSRLHFQTMEIEPAQLMKPGTIHHLLLQASKVGQQNPSQEEGLTAIEPA